MAAFTAELGKETGRTSVILTIDGNSFTLCSLTPGKIENQPIDIYLSQDDEITFTVKGPCPVDLTGNVVAIISPEDDLLEDDMLDQYGMMEDGVDEEIDSDEASAIDMDEVDEDGIPINVDLANESDEDELTEADLALLKKKLKEAGDAEEMDFSSDMDEDELMQRVMALESGSEEEDSEDEEDEESDDEEEMEFDAALIAELNKRKAVQPIPRNEKKAKITEIVEEPKKTEEKKVEKKTEKKEAKKATPAPAKEETKKESAKKQVPAAKEESKKESKKPVAEAPKKEAASSPAEAKESKEPTKRTLPSGLIIEDASVGTGPRAKSGQRVSVRYIGKLTNGKTFDSNTKGAPFSFKLGKGNVIKGWDMGVQGMNVGGTRKLTIPPALAYGKQGAAPDIPKNATLEFEVKLLAIK